MSKKYVFIDETGNANLHVEKDGVSSLFIVTAIVVDAESLDFVNNEVLTVIKNDFSGGEIKSSNIGKNSKRRMMVHNKLKHLPLHVYSFVVHKSKLDKDSGYQYKKSFMKNINKHLYKKIYNTYPDVEIYADEHGSPEFMNSFIEYIKVEAADLFSLKIQPHFVNSKEFPIVQVADLYSGTLNKKFDTTQKDDFKDRYIRIFRKQIISIEHYPFDTKIEMINSNVESHTEDLTIKSTAINLAQSYIKNIDESNDDELLKVSILKKLLDNLMYIDSHEYINHHSIIRKVKPDTGIELSKNKFYKLIGELRDSGVLIASSSNGYKIPISVNEMVMFIKHVNNSAIPYLKRMFRAHQKISEVTSKNVDVIDLAKCSDLKEFFEIFQNSKMGLEAEGARSNEE